MGRVGPSCHLRSALPNLQAPKIAALVGGIFHFRLNHAPQGESTLEILCMEGKSKARNHRE
jgi:hypothetical protein